MKLMLHNASGELWCGRGGLRLTGAERGFVLVYLPRQAHAFAHSKPMQHKAGSSDAPVSLTFTNAPGTNAAAERIVCCRLPAPICAERSEHHKQTATTLLPLIYCSCVCMSV
jgi:hypothetical protein